MRKIIDETVKILKELAVDIHKGTTAIDAGNRVIRLALALEAENAKHERIAEEKLDFLIFMQSKRTTSSGKEVVISGDVLFQQWRNANESVKQVKAKQEEKAKEVAKDLKPIPNEQGNNLPPKQ